MTNTPDYPLAVLWTWENHHKALGFIADVDRALAARDSEMARLQAELDALKGQHRELGIERGEHETNAEVFRDSVEHWCKTHGDLPLPPEPALPKPEPAPEFDPRHDASIWANAECRWCEGQIIRDSLHGGSWKHFATGREVCTVGDGSAAEPAPEPGPLEVAVTHMADVRVANGDPRALETREQPAVPPAEDPETTRPDAPADTEEGETDA